MRQRRPSEDNASYVTPELLVFNRPIFKNIVSVPIFGPACALSVTPLKVES